MKNPLKEFVRKLGNAYIRRICRDEAQNQKGPRQNERSIEYRFALESLTRLRPTNVLDVGTGTSAWPHVLRTCGFVTTAIDNVRDYWDHPMVNRHWDVLNVDITNPEGFHGPFEVITCISVMEHIVEHEKAVSNLTKLLRPGGVLLLTTPYNHYQCCDNVYRRPDALYGQDLPYICRSHSAREIQQWQNTGLRIKHRELWRLFSGPVWATGERVPVEQVQSEDAPHQLGCFEFEKI